MNEAIGNSMIFNIVITIVAVAIGIVFFSLGYSKTYKTKTKLIEIIENNGGYIDTDTDLKNEIDTYLKNVGYSSFVDGNTCPTLDGLNAINTLDAYKYCVYEHVTVKGKYYTVKVYMSYNLPIIGDVIKLRYSIRGDTILFYDF